MSMDQRSLSEYENTDPLAGVTLPDRDGYGWEDEPVTLKGGLSAVRADTESNSDFLTLNGDTAIRASAVYYVVDDESAVSEYLDQHGEGEIDIPQYYSRFDDWEPHLSVVTARGRGHGAGIPRSRLEAALRVATGGGRYSPTSIDVTPCGHGPFLIHTEGGTFAFGLDSVTLSESPEPCATVAGMEVAEEDAEVLDGIEAAVSVFSDAHNVEITGYRKLNHDSYHVFQTADGRPLKVPGHILRELPRLSDSPEEVLGSHEFETQYGETYEAEWEEIHYGLGESPTGLSTPVVGYQFKFDDPRSGSRVSMSGRVKAYASYYMLSLREQEDQFTARRSTRDERLGRFETENEDYDPMGSHL